MLFTSKDFWILFMCVALSIQFNFYFIKSIKFQNILLLITSYYFYGSWDWSFLWLIIFISLHTYFFAYLINKRPNKKIIWLILAGGINLGVLFYFKYVGFFVGELEAFSGMKVLFAFKNIILPVGISFYIFQTFTYVFDVYKGVIGPEKSLLKYLTFVAFFPQLVAGPIERASNLLPQFGRLKSVKIENFYIGLRSCIIGLFIKVFIADSLAETVDVIFNNYEAQSSSVLFVGALSFTIQIYGDFCGYSMIAIGVAKIIDFDLMENFRRPYFSSSLQDFWRRWHISLSSFFRDYLYIPIGGGRVEANTVLRNVLVTFLVSGLWHGANWTFILWGGLHGLFIFFERKYLDFLKFPILKWGITMSLVMVLWVLFRSKSVYDFFLYIKYMFEFKGAIKPNIGGYNFVFIIMIIFSDLLIPFNKNRGIITKNLFEGFSLALMLILVIGTIRNVNPNFIYFQF